MTSIHDYLVIPRTITSNKELSPLDKLVLIELAGLNSLDITLINNEHLATQFNVSIRRIQQVISNLEKHKLVSRQNIGGTSTLETKVTFTLPQAGNKDVLVTGEKYFTPSTGHCSEITSESSPNTNNINNNILYNNINNNIISNSSVQVPPNKPNKLLPPAKKTKYAGLVRLYQTLYDATYGTPYFIPNVAKHKRAVNTILERYSEKQLMALLLVYFDWRGISGKDQWEWEKLYSAGFPIEWVGTMSNKLVAYITKTLGVDFNNDDELKASLDKWYASFHNAQK